jgi:hypothetical protein
MKMLKYLKLYEAFRSEKLSKTLAYINKSSKEDFLRQLKSITAQIDYPLSELNDEQFQYLPFNKALNVYQKPEQKPCQATSKSQFGPSGIDGEKCESGRVRRRWGEGTRMVTCEACSGTGIESEKSDIKYIKFWFTQNGEFVTTSACDGIKRGDGAYGGKTFTKQQFAQAKKIKTIRNGERNWWDQLLDRANHLVPAQYVWSEKSNKLVYGYLFVTSGSVFFIQNESDMDGGSPGDRTWKDYGTYSWSLKGGEFDQITILDIDTEGPDEGDNPYFWNAILSISGRSLRILTSDFESRVQPAHFAIILDLHKLKATPHKPASETSSERGLAREGSLKLKTDEEIRRENIKRYLDAIVLKSDIISDIKNAKSVLRRFTAGNYPLYHFVENSRTPDKIGSLISKYYGVLESDSEVNRESKLKALSDYIQSVYRDTSQISNNVSQNLGEIQKILQKHDFSDVNIELLEIETHAEYKSRVILIFDLIQKLNRAIKDKLDSIAIETIEDIEVYKLKVRSIIDVVRNDGTTTGDFWRICAFCEDIVWGPNRSERALSRFNTVRVQSKFESVCRSIESLVKIVERL